MRLNNHFMTKDTHGVLERLVDSTRVTSDGLQWTSMYASTQNETPFEAYFSSVKDELLVLHRSGSTNVDIMYGEKLKRKKVPAGSFHLVPGGAAFGFRLFSEIETLHCYLRREIVEEVAAELVVGDPSKVSINADFHDDDPTMRNLMQAVMYALEDNDYANSLYVDCLSRAVATQLVRGYSNAKLRQNENIPTSSQITPVVREAIEYMREHLDESITLESIASVINRSPSHFARQFRTEVGMPPYQFLVNMRLDRAQELLATSRISIAEIAYECGFSHQEHLTRLFKRRFADTPASYRKSKQS